MNAYIAAVKAVAALADWIKASDEDLELLGFANLTMVLLGLLLPRVTQEGD